MPDQAAVVKPFIKVYNKEDQLDVIYGPEVALTAECLHRNRLGHSQYPSANPSRRLASSVRANLGAISGLFDLGWRTGCGTDEAVWFKRTRELASGLASGLG